MQNLTLRFLSSIFLIIIFLSLLSANDQIFLFVLQTLLIVSTWEFLRLINFSLNQDKINNHFLSRERINFHDFFLIFIINFSILVFYSLESNLFGLFVISLLIIFLFFLLRSNFKKFFGLIYIILPFVILIQLRHDENFFEILTFIVLFSVTTDVSSYFFGNFFGGMKLAPKISPGKTISGSIGGVIIPSLICILFYSKNTDILYVVISSIIFSIFVQIGDLVESYFKRSCFVKDSSNLIPGHGGVLDRFDGIFLLIIIVYLLKILDFNFFFIV